MRKLLLTSVCALGALGMASGANAQGGMNDLPNPMQGSMVMKPGPTPGANNNNNAFGTARPGPSGTPTPGTLVIHFNSRVTVQWLQGWSSTMGAVAGNTRSSNQIGSWLRLYGGADGMAANGLRYGGAFEIRTNFSGASNTPSTTNPASQAGAQTNLMTLYVRRAFVYAGTDKLGIVRFGMGDGMISLFSAGRTTVQFYSPTSHFNGSDLQATAIAGNTAPPFAFIDGSGDEYDTQKVVYLSPNFSGFDFGLQYSPHAGNSIAGCASVGSTCASLTTSSTAADGARFKDLLGVGVRYSGNVGPVSVLAYGVYSYGGHVNYSGTAAGARAAVGAPAASTWNGQFDNLNFGSAGVALTWQGLTIGANYIGGAVNGRMAARPSGGASMSGILAGLAYQVPGTPLTIGGVYMQVDSQGAVALTGLSQRHEYGFSFGGSYTLAPGMVLFADYLYQNRKQSLFNFAGAAGAGAVGTANNQVQGQGIVFGTQMTW